MNNITNSYEELYDSLENLSPETIAEILFSKVPDDPQSKQLLLESPDDENTGTYIHEILLIILMEGIMKFNNNLEYTILDNIEISHIDALNPWFKSLRFNMKIIELNKELDIEEYKHYYSKIILKKMPEYTLYFTIHNLEKEYTFFFNSLYGKKYPKKNIDEIYSVLFIENRVFKINFTLI